MINLATKIYIDDSIQIPDDKGGWKNARTSEEEKLRIFKYVDDTIACELTQAGIKLESFEGLRYGGEYYKEVPTKHVGILNFWSFKRAWIYYIAQGPGIDSYIAENFHKEWGQEVRVDGHCGCPSPKEQFGGFAVGHYHIDTQEGLNAFAKLLRTIYIKG